MRRFNTAIGSPNYFSNNTQCNAGRFIAFHLNYGCWPQADFRNTNLAIFWGTNSPAAHSYWTHIPKIKRAKRTAKPFRPFDLSVMLPFSHNT